MYTSFKNLELLRHQVSTRLESAVRLHSASTQNNTSGLSSTIFASALSLVASIVAQGYFSVNSKKYIWSFCVFIPVYIVAYLVYERLSRLIRKKVYNRKKHREGATSLDIKAYIDDFDHIACDYNLIASGFMKKYDKDIDLREATYDFYEVFYYSKVSASKIDSVLVHSESCINTLEKADGIDLFRICNQLDLLDEAMAFLQKHWMDKEIQINDNLRPVLIQQIISLSGKVDRCRDKCNNIAFESFGDTKINDLRQKNSLILEHKTSKFTASLHKPIIET